MLTRPDIYAFALATIALIFAGVLLVMDKSVPTELWMVVTGSAGVGAGVNVTKP